ncbi:MAG: FkbM family methyltransferase [Armatimonadetes bacterium]|nr:FkbM family methyltransferase [Akkermansiaceae bacterium]
MKTLLLSLKRLLGKNGWFICKTTPYELVETFIRGVRPLTTNHELIRMGSEYDGGYLLPNDLTGINACFSPGVSNTSDFEVQIADLGIKCYMADYSVEAPPLNHALFEFERKFLGAENNQIFMTLENWVSRNAPEGNDLLLQMDIEGYEYDVILNTSSQILQRFRIIVIEFHDLEHMLDKLGFFLINSTFAKLLQDFEIVHIHPNNIKKANRAIYKSSEVPSVIEVTFLRKDRIEISTVTNQFPHKLDRPNSLHFEDYSLPACWYQH